MTCFLVSLALLIGGYFVYGLLVERVIGCDPKRTMPCYARRDGVDYLSLIHI